MGLTMTQSLLERLGGSIEVKSRKGVGSLFRIRIPLVSASVADAISLTDQPPASNFGVHS